MTGACLNLAWAGARVALLLELLHHAWSNLLPPDDLSLALAIRARRYIVFIVGPAASAVRTDHVAVILQFKIGPCVELCQWDCDFQVYTWSCPFSPITIDSKTNNEKKLARVNKKLARATSTYYRPNMPPKMSPKGLPREPLSSSLTHFSPQRSYLRRLSASERTS